MNISWKKRAWKKRKVPMALQYTISTGAKTIIRITLWSSWTSTLLRGQDRCQSTTLALVSSVPLYSRKCVSLLSNPWKERWLEGLTVHPNIIMIVLQREKWNRNRKRRRRVPTWTIMMIRKIKLTLWSSCTEASSRWSLSLEISKQKFKESKRWLLNKIYRSRNRLLPSNKKSCKILRTAQLGNLFIQTAWLIYGIANSIDLCFMLIK